MITCIWKYNWVCILISLTFYNIITNSLKRTVSKCSLFAMRITMLNAYDSSNVFDMKWKWFLSEDIKFIFQIISKSY